MFGEALNWSGPYRSSQPLGLTRVLSQAGSTKAAVTDPTKSSQMLVIVPPHPLIQHWVAVARNKQTPSSVFRGAIAELGHILIYEATRDLLATITGQVETPCGLAEVTALDPTVSVKVVPILRAGLALLEKTDTLLPLCKTYHVGIIRDDKTLQPSMYLNRLPPSFSEKDIILVCDPMLATGGSIMMALDEVISRGGNPKNIRVISVLAAPPALNKMSKKYPGMRVYAAMLDSEVNDKGFIIPGLGDCGDRCFNTGSE